MNRNLSSLSQWIHRHSALWVVGGLSLLASCTVKVPSHIIQEREMENLLYDYHLMQAMAGDLGGGSNVKRMQYEQYVFDKHGVTEAEFDSSLAWYMRNTRKMEEIYRKLNTRFMAQKEALAAVALPNQRIDKISNVGDTVDVWPDYRLLRLTDAPMRNRVSFTLSADSNYHVRDSFVWQMQACFLGEKVVRTRAVMTLTLFMDKDTIGATAGIDSTGRYVLTLHCDSNYALKQMVGNVYYYPLEKDTIPSVNPGNLSDNLILSGISLVRYHRTDTTVVAAMVTDSVKAGQDAKSEEASKKPAQETVVKQVEKVVGRNEQSLRQTRRSLIKKSIDKE